MNIPIDEQRNTLNALAKQGVQHFPVVREVVPTLKRRCPVMQRFASGPYSYLLESANQGGEKWSRYSMIGLPARRVYKIQDKRSVLKRLAKPLSRANSSIRSSLYLNTSEVQLPHYRGLSSIYGWSRGLFGYDTVRYVEPRLANSTPPETINTPDILLMLSEDVIVFDNVKGKVQLITHVSDLSDDQFLQRN